LYSFKIKFYDIKVRYIYSVEGVAGLYRGVGMKIISHSIGTVVYEKVSKVFKSFLLDYKSFFLIIHKKAVG